MKATYDITVKFTMVHEVENPSDIIGPHDVAQFVVDQLTTEKSVAAYDVLETSIDVR